MINLIATILKFGDNTNVGAVLLATSLAATIQLIVAAIILSIYGNTDNFNDGISMIIISLSGGAL